MKAMTDLYERIRDALKEVRNPPWMARTAIPDVRSPELLAQDQRLRAAAKSAAIPARGLLKHYSRDARAGGAG